MWVLGIALFLTGYSGPGSCGFASLKIRADARIAAIGCAGTGGFSGGASILENPAGIVRSPHQLTSTYLNYIVGIHAGFLGYVYPIRQAQGLGFGVSYLNYGNIPETTPENPTGAGNGTYSAADFLVALGYGRRVVKDLDLGGALKTIYEKIHDYSGMALAVDFGMRYGGPMRGLSLGLAMRNLGFQNKPFIEERARLPLLWEFGVNQQLLNHSLSISGDLGYALDTKFYYELGVEYLLMEIVSIRMGYRSPGRDLRTGSGMDILAGTSAGVGVVWKRLSIDYAFVPYNELGNTHRISLSISLGRETFPSQRPIDPLKEAEAYRKRGDWASAAVAYEKVISSRKGDARIYQWLGYCYYKLGRREDAIMAYEKALELDPDNERIKKSLRLLKGEQ
ncbi:hypothetical protein DRP53_02755 [candidate division WOR-3 bacterium]|uniref:Tetratricopeptide repeat protein n=1 Tax=candidate division WOR-3 bacterium TaxID=2052148 RepID=A0A660SK65_UNCW3|nr:MAG: hypothetical protein DRP53_02755 [candidate division WOR-3 bacterium]